MNGSVRQRGEKWSYRIDLGVINGKRKQKEKGGFSSSKDAKAAMQLAIAELIKTGTVRSNKKITVKEVFEEFIIYEAPITRKYATIKRYQSIYTNHLHIFDDRVIGEISSNELQTFITNKMQVDGLSREYTRSIYNYLFTLWGYAYKKEYMVKNEMLNMVPPKQYRNVGDTKVFTREELSSIHNRIKDTNLLTAFLLGLHLGLRSGEVFALRWSDIDLDECTVNVCRQLQSENKCWCFTTLKTDNSYRKIKFDNELKDYLCKIKELREQHKAFYGISYKPNTLIDKTKNPEGELITVDDLINVKPSGQMLNTDNTKFIARLVRADLGIDFRFHNLRHTHATILLEAGINPKYICERLGHSKLEFTLRLYTHVTRSMDDKAVEALNFSL